MLHEPKSRERGYEGRLIVAGDDEIGAGDARLDWADGLVTRSQSQIDAAVASVLSATFVGAAPRSRTSEGDP